MSADPTEPSSRFPEIEKAALGPDGGLLRAESLLCAWLAAHPSDLRALQLLGSVYIRLGRYEDAERPLARALEISPGFAAARWMLAGTFYHRGDWEKTLSQVDRLLEDVPGKAQYLELKAHALLRLGDPGASIGVYETLLPQNPTADNWKSYGQALKAMGQRDRAIAAYRKAIALQPSYGRAYWCLAELKTFRFSPDDIAGMNEVLKQPAIGNEDRGRIHFALGKAAEDQNEHSAAFEQYRKGNALFRPAARQTAEESRAFVRRNKAVFTRQFFRERVGWGSPSPAPIFIVGLPRSGTTLIEQILSSHSAIEPASELQLLETVARRLCAKGDARATMYPEAMQGATANDIRAAGEEYLAAVQAYRKLNRPYFIDKMPINFTYLGFLCTALPNARVIDARRHPLGVGFGIFKHYFERAYTFAFDLEDIGRYYRNYVELMAHFDAVLLGRVHRVFYENMVTNTEEEIRKLLDYCGVPFEEACLRFHETKRAVLTPSSEQVRRPIFTEGMEQWKDYGEQLQPLKAALGDVLTMYPEVPEFPEAPADAGAGWQISAEFSSGGSFVRRYS